MKVPKKYRSRPRGWIMLIRVLLFFFLASSTYVLAAAHISKKTAPATISKKQAALVWIKIPFIPASGNTQIFVHYGDSEISSKSNGLQTFEFFDDFNTQDLNWLETGALQNNAKTEFSSRAWTNFDNRTVMKMNGPYEGGNAYKLVYNKEFTFNTGLATGTRLYSPRFDEINRYNYDVGAGLAFQSNPPSKPTSQPTSYRTGWYGGNAYGWSDKSYGTIYDGNAALVDDDSMKIHDVWYTIENQIIPNTRVDSQLYTSRYHTLEVSGTNQSRKTMTNTTYPLIEALNLGYFDWFYLRKYISPEPIISPTEYPDEINGPDETTLRYPIQIQNSTTTNLTDYQIRLSVSYHDGMQEDFDDLRFTTDGTNELSYWVEDIIEIDDLPPQTITDLQARNLEKETGESTDRIELFWTESSEDSDDPSAKKVNTFDVRYFETAPTGETDGARETWWNAATPYSPTNFTRDGHTLPTWKGTTPGTEHSEWIVGLPREKTLYFAVRSYDLAGNASTISNITSHITTFPPVVKWLGQDDSEQDLEQQYGQDQRCLNEQWGCAVEQNVGTIDDEYRFQAYFEDKDSETGNAGSILTNHALPYIPNAFQSFSDETDPLHNRKLTDGEIMEFVFSPSSLLGQTYSREDGTNEIITDEILYGRFRNSIELQTGSPYDIRQNWSASDLDPSDNFKNDPKNITDFDGSTFWTGNNTNEILTVQIYSPNLTGLWISSPDNELILQNIEAGYVDSSTGETIYTPLCSQQCKPNTFILFSPIGGIKYLRISQPNKESWIISEIFTYNTQGDTRTISDNAPVINNNPVASFEINPPSENSFTTEECDENNENDCNGAGSYTQTYELIDLSKDIFDENGSLDTITEWSWNIDENGQKNSEGNWDYTCSLINSLLGCYGTKPEFLDSVYTTEGTNITLRFTRPGKYFIKLNVRDQWGWWDETEDGVMHSIDTTNENPIAAFDINPPGNRNQTTCHENYQCNGENGDTETVYSFTQLSSDIDSNQNLTCTWYIDDPNTAIFTDDCLGVPPEQTFTHGSHFIQLEVFDEYGGFDEVKHQIEIIEDIPPLELSALITCVTDQSIKCDIKEKTFLQNKSILVEGGNQHENDERSLYLLWWIEEENSGELISLPGSQYCGSGKESLCRVEGNQKASFILPGFSRELRGGKKYILHLCSLQEGESDRNSPSCQTNTDSHNFSILPPFSKIRETNN